MPKHLGTRLEPLRRTDLPTGLPVQRRRLGGRATHHLLGQPPVAQAGRDAHGHGQHRGHVRAGPIRLGHAHGQHGPAARAADGDCERADVHHGAAGRRGCFAAGVLDAVCRECGWCPERVDADQGAVAVVLCTCSISVSRLVISVPQTRPDRTSIKDPTKGLLPGEDAER